jgi:hypothetical protein
VGRVSRRRLALSFAPSNFLPWAWQLAIDPAVDWIEGAAIMITCFVVCLVGPSRVNVLRLALSQESATLLRFTVQRLGYRLQRPYYRLRRSTTGRRTGSFASSTM